MRVEHVRLPRAAPDVRFPVRWPVYGGAVLVSLVVGLGLAYKPRDTVVLVAALAAAALATTRPGWFGAALVVSLLFPYAWSPNVFAGPVPVMVLLMVPGAVAAGLVLLAHGRIRLTWCDGAVIGLVATAFLSEAMTGHGHRYSLELAKAAIVPYVGFRLVFVAWPSAMRRLPDAFIWVGVAASGIAVWEVLSGGNPFIGGPVNPLLARWAVNVHRGGVIRAAATFGHPIALGSFLVVPIVIAFAQRRWRLLGILAVGELLTLSRGPWIAAILAVFLYAALTHGLQRLWLIAVLVTVVGLFVGPVRHVVSSSFQTGTVEQANATYRTQLIGSTLGSLTLWGNPQPDTEQSFLLSRLTPTDITSEPALIASKQGVWGLAVWIVLLGSLVAATVAASRRRDDFLLPLAVAAIGLWIAMISVALITTLAVTFWLVAACVATSWSDEDTRCATAESNPSNRSLVGPSAVDDRLGTARS